MRLILSVIRAWRSGLRYAIILALPLFALRPLPSLAQACPNPPNVTISMQAPSDVAPFPNNCNPIDFFDDFSWRSFIAMIWPAQQGMRGVPDQTKDIGPVSGPLVFETLKADWEVFQPSPDGKNPPPAPSPWNSYSGQNPCFGFGVKNIGFGDLVLAAFSKFGNLGEAGFGNLVGPLPAQNSSASAVAHEVGSEYTRYFTAFNETEFNQILDNRLDLRQHLPPEAGGSGTPVKFPDGALDIKAAWIDMTNVRNPDRYYRRKAWVLNPFAQKCEQRTVGLVGLHIVRKTTSRPQWIWSTFEQIDNVPGGEFTGPFAYNNGPGTPPMPTTNPNGWPPSATPTAVNVSRLKPIHSSTVGTNQIYRSALKAKGGPWQFYQLVMTQWPLDANKPDEPGSPPNTFPGSGGNPPGSFAQTAHANVALETFDQVPISKGCMSCHTGAQGTTDFLWSLEVNAWPSNIAAPSTPMLALRPSPQAALAARTLPPPLAALKELMQSGTPR